MRLTIIEAEDAQVGDKADGDGGVRLLEGGEDRGQQAGNAGDGGDDEVTRDGLTLTLDAGDELAELFFGGLGDAEQFLPGLCRGVAPGVALEQFGAEAFFQRVDVADHGGVVDAEHFGCAGYGAEAGDLIGGADLIPGFGLHVCASLNSVVVIWRD